MDDRQIKLTNEFKAYQQRFQFTHDDIHSRENKISQLEYELEDTANLTQINKNQIHDLQTVNAGLKADVDCLVEQKKNADREITRLEANVTELQMDFAATHQALKKELSRLETQVHNLNDQLDQSEKLIESLNNQLNCEKDKTRKLEYQVEDLDRDMSLKNEEV